MSATTTNPLHGGDRVSDSEALFVEESLTTQTYQSVEMTELNHDTHAPKSANGHGNHNEDVSVETRLPSWLGDHIEHVFKLRKRKATVESEFYYGIVQFISCLYVLPVVPYQMKRVGYDETYSIIATSAMCAIGCIAASFLTDMPFIIAPPTSVSIFLAVSMQQQNMEHIQGNAVVMWSGVALTVVGAIPPLMGFVTKLIPNSIQAATAVGIGLITALAGATEINLVVRGKYTILDMGPITTEVAVAMCALVIVAAMLHYHIKGAFCTGLIFGTFVWWIISHEWPEALVARPEAEHEPGLHSSSPQVVLLIFNLLFLYILTLNGLARSLSDLAGLTKKSGAIPRAGWLFIVCGLSTVLSGYFSGPPILISPESAAGIKAGAKTGFSTLVCGILFAISTFFYPVFAAVPAAGTAPLLIMVGIVLFANVKRIDWTVYQDAVPAYCVLFFIPFTYSILRGVAFGYVIYVFLGFFTGQMITNTEEFVRSYTNPPPKAPKHHPDDDKHHEETHVIGRMLSLLDAESTNIQVEAL